MYTTSKNLDVLLKPSMEELCQTELRNKKKVKIFEVYIFSRIFKKRELCENMYSFSRIFKKRELREKICTARKYLRS